MSWNRRHALQAEVKTPNSLDRKHLRAAKNAARSIETTGSKTCVSSSVIVFIKNEKHTHVKDWNQAPVMVVYPIIFSEPPQEREIFEIQMHFSNISGDGAPSPCAIFESAWI